MHMHRKYISRKPYRLHQSCLRWHTALCRRSAHNSYTDNFTSQVTASFNLGRKNVPNFHRYKYCTTKWVTNFVEQTCSTDYCTVFRCAEEGQISGFDPLQRKFSQVSSVRSVGFNPPVCWTRSKSTVGSVPPTRQHGRYRRSVRLHLRRIMVNIDGRFGS